MLAEYVEDVTVKITFVHNEPEGSEVMLTDKRALELIKSKVDADSVQLISHELYITKEPKFQKGCE